MMVMDEILAMAGPEPVEPGVPDKLFFRIGEVSQIVGVEPYVVRYWESVFRSLSPKQSGSGQRMFRRKDVELLLEIKRLLYDRKFTVEGARRVLSERSVAGTVINVTERSPRQGSLFTSASALPEIRQELAEILKLLDSAGEPAS
jgi:DNA-binding transcriptional MerR regulator